MADTEVLIKWTGLLDFESTWEPVSRLLVQFPHFHLEDKVASLRDNDRLWVPYGYMQQKKRSKGRKAHTFDNEGSG